MRCHAAVAGAPRACRGRLGLLQPPGPAALHLCADGGPVRAGLPHDAAEQGLSAPGIWRRRIYVVRAM